MILENKSTIISFNFDEVKGIFTGYASVFNEVDRVKDTISPNAYDDELKAWKEGKNIPINFEHKKSILLSSNVTRMEVDQKGLLVEWKFSEEAKALYPDVWQWAVSNAKAGKLFMSIGYNVLDSILGAERQILKKKSMEADTIYKLELDHIAATDNPVDTKAQILEVKSQEPNYNSMIKDLSGKIAAKRFLKEYKSELSNTNIENFIDQVFSLSKESETQEKSLPKEAPVQGGEIDLDSLLNEVANKLNNNK